MGKKYEKILRGKYIPKIQMGKWYVQILNAIDRFSTWPTAKRCKTSDAKEVINFLISNFNLYGIPEGKSNKTRHLCQKIERIL